MSGVPALLVGAFLVVPVLEIYLILQVGQVIGGWQTVALLVAESLLGAWLVRREGRRTWRTLQAAFRGARMPGRELIDGALVLVGGTLLLTPGFLTDAVGFFLLLPVTRPLARRMLTSLLTRRALAAASRAASRVEAASFAEGERRRPPVLRGEVVREHDEAGSRPPEEDPTRR